MKRTIIKLRYHTIYASDLMYISIENLTMKFHLQSMLGQQSACLEEEYDTCLERDEERARIEAIMIADPSNGLAVVPEM